jgi:hypothetical protein
VKKLLRLKLNGRSTFCLDNEIIIMINAAITMKENEEEKGGGGKGGELVHLVSAKFI